jgi:hypothetical protein
MLGVLNLFICKVPLPFEKDLIFLIVSKKFLAFKTKEFINIFITICSNSHFSIIRSKDFPVVLYCWLHICNILFSKPLE